jgi:hypothetical protein
MLAKELEGIRSRKWNSERFIVFQMVILQRSKNVSKTGDIKRRLSKRMDSWEEGKIDMLVQDSERTALAQLARLRGEATPAQRAKTYNRLVLQGKLRTAVRWLIEREKGGVLQPGDTTSLMYSSPSIQPQGFRKPPKWRTMIPSPTLLTWTLLRRPSSR